MVRGELHRVRLPCLEASPYRFPLFLGKPCESFVSPGCKGNFIRGTACSQAEPEAGFFIVLVDTIALFVKPSDGQLRPDIALIGGYAIPLQCFQIIPWHALSLFIKLAKPTILSPCNQVLHLNY